MLEALEGNLHTELEFLEAEVPREVRVDEPSQVEEAFKALTADLTSPEFFEELMTATISAGKLVKLDPPCSVDFLLDLQFDSAGEPQGISFKAAAKPRNWSSYMAKNEQMPEPQQTLSEPMTPQQIEELLTQTVELSPSNSAEATLNLLQQLTFDLRSHTFYTVPQMPSLDNFEEESKGPVLVLPNHQKKDASRYCIVDNSLAVSTFPIKVPNPAKTFPFELDDFQKRAIIRLEEGQNVFVAAHTSAGKTVVAEYAIALCRKRMSRVFYTSPIKALSNQKYREFKDRFKEVGIMTGDVAVDTESFCLIMTTEVLRSMLYKGSPKIRDLEWVILDEVHYINDPERGVVWEEVLIMLPPHVHVVMLSATVPNYQEFTEWVGRVRKQRVYVQCTFKRPVPLVHSAYMLGNIVTLMDSESNQNFAEYSRATREIEGRMNRAPKGAKQRVKKSGKKDFKKMAVNEDSRFMKLIQDLKQNNLLPCVMFAFSRDKADSRAMKLSKSNLLEDGAKAAVKRFIDKVLTRLQPIDRELPQVQMVSHLLLEGVGVHHSGILPILKEMVEILFSKGILKVLVATETFAMGLNMPTKTVVFSEIRKFDGSENRYLQPGEYTQMSGRAGRRGIDAEGNVIIFIKDNSHPPSPKVLTEIMQSKPLSLTSKFRLRYNMIASLLMNETMDIKELINKSYRENSATLQTSASKNHQIKAQITRLRALVNPDAVGSCSELTDLLRLNAECRDFNKKSMSVGAVLIIINNKFAGQEAILVSAGETLKCLALSANPSLEKKVGNLSYSYESVRYSELLAVHRAPPKSKFNIKEGAPLMRDMLERHLKYIADATRGPRFTSRQLFKEVPDERDELVTRIISSQFMADPQRHDQWRNFLESAVLERQLAEEPAGGESEGQYDNMIEVMKQFSLVDAKSMLALKGRSIAPLTNPYCLIICECVFRGILRELNDVELPAFFCIFVTEGKSPEKSDWTDLSPALDHSLKGLIAIHTEIMALENAFQVENEMTNKLVTSLVEPVYMWALGKPFVEICDITDIKEGNIVRTILRTHELLGNLKESAVMIGDALLKQRLEDAQAKMRRDIVFATSLYIKS
jgi:antiviral helicase SKI2